MEHFMLGLPTPDSLIQAAFASVYGGERAGIFFGRADFAFENGEAWPGRAAIGFQRKLFGN